MTIQITQPEVEALINQCLQTGKFRNAEDVILQALQSFSINVVATRRVANERY